MSDAARHLRRMFALPVVSRALTEDVRLSVELWYSGSEFFQHMHSLLQGHCAVVEVRTVTGQLVRVKLRKRT